MASARRRRTYGPLVKVSLKRHFRLFLVTKKNEAIQTIFDDYDILARWLVPKYISKLAETLRHPSNRKSTV